MDPAARSGYNAVYDAALFGAYRSELERRLGCSPGFRLAETPLFLTEAFVGKLERATREIVAQLLEPARAEALRAAVPARYDVPGCSALPEFAAFDFAVTRTPDGTLEPQLVELQGFPSLLAFEMEQGDAWATTLRDVPGLARAWTGRFGERDREALRTFALRTIVGTCDPATVALVDIDPPRQKTACDFVATRNLFRVEAVAIDALTKRGKKLFRRDAAGREVPVERIFWRVIVDELERSGVQPGFDLRDELDVEWAPHPNWFWRWSKYALPFLDHAAVPRTRFLADVDALPDDLAARYVLKPLFSFAGGGVNVAPTAADVAAIPADQGRGWCLQERIAYEPVVDAPDGGAAKAEVRVMLLRPDGAPALEPVLNLVRLTRGAMVGVDYNKNVAWTGSTIGLWS